ncbi:DUF2290 domain-containing protein [Pseudomonas sp. PDM13]|uniref:DUF2290 domain-containing protein n=1 Tax=Pseudomonas sp. PDM13 TaxID=2769255 RepID=UPI0021DF64B1|nr:DUF2290 domain-containing protein [Pseudomonas sp. PDM13]MCU9949521.1 DUF2290 domain-containing protein [Pseudomonas sp. PDM13]
MRASQPTIITAINNVKSILQRAGLLYDYNDCIAERVAQGKVRVTWSTATTRPDLTDIPDSNIKEYLIYLSGRHFNFQLFDGSLIQISYDIKSGSIVQSRLVWFPCPVSFEPEELEYASLEELIRTAPNENIHCRAPLRFDYAPHQAADNHSSTHVHLGMENFRLPVQRPMEPRRFIRFIVRTAYPDVWSSPEFIRDDVENWSAQDRLDEDDKIYGSLNWNIPI